VGSRGIRTRRRDKNRVTGSVSAEQAKRKNEGAKPSLGTDVSPLLQTSGRRSQGSQGG
jgi:hypothetical protein